MQVVKYTDPQLINSIEKDLRESEYWIYLEKIINDIFKEYHCYVWGGAVRDSIVGLNYNKNLPIKDLDILIDDSKKCVDFKESLQGLEGIFYTRFGSPKWKPIKGIEIDIVTFSNATMMRNKKNLSASLDVVLQSCDFTTSAIIYDPKEKVVHSCGAIEGIDKQEVDILYSEGDEMYVLLCRAILQAERLEFQKGPRAMQPIKEKYSSDMDDHIKKYMEYKGLEKKFDYVIQELKKIKESN